MSCSQETSRMDLRDKIAHILRNPRQSVPLNSANLAALDRSQTESGNTSSASSSVSSQPDGMPYSPPVSRLDVSMKPSVQFPRYPFSRPLPTGSYATTSPPADGEAMKRNPSLLQGRSPNPLQNDNEPLIPQEPKARQSSMLVSSPARQSSMLVSSSANYVSFAKSVVETKHAPQNNHPQLRERAHIASLPGKQTGIQKSVERSSQPAARSGSGLSTPHGRDQLSPLIPQDNNEDSSLPEPRAPLARGHGRQSSIPGQVFTPSHVVPSSGPQKARRKRFPRQPPTSPLVPLTSASSPGSVHIEPGVDNNGVSVYGRRRTIISEAHYVRRRDTIVEEANMAEQQQQKPGHCRRISNRFKNFMGMKTSDQASSPVQGEGNMGDGYVFDYYGAPLQATGIAKIASAPLMDPHKTTQQGAPPMQPQTNQGAAQKPRTQLPENFETQPSQPIRTNAELSSLLQREDNGDWLFSVSGYRKEKVFDRIEVMNFVNNLPESQDLFLGADVAKSVSERKATRDKDEERKAAPPPPPSRPPPPPPPAPYPAITIESDLAFFGGFLSAKAPQGPLIPDDPPTPPMTNPQTFVETFAAIPVTRVKDILAGPPIQTDLPTPPTTDPQKFIETFAPVDKPVKIRRRRVPRNCLPKTMEALARYDLEEPRPCSVAAVPQVDVKEVDEVRSERKKEIDERRANRRKERAVVSGRKPSHSNYYRQEREKYWVAVPAKE